MNSIIWAILLQIFLILLNAIFSCAEIAIISMNDTKLANMAKNGNKKAIRLTKLTSQPSRFLATIQVAITLSGFLGSAFAADTFSDKIVAGLVNMGVKLSASTLNSISVILITLILSYFTLVLGELVPKRIGMRQADKLALGMSGLISMISKIFRPIVGLLTVSTNGILRLIGINPNEEDEKVTEEEIRMMIDAGSEKGTIHSDEKEMIQNVFEFNDLTADEICTHRKDVDFLWMEKDMENWEKIIHETRHSLYPIYKDGIDDIIGILNAKDYFRLYDKSRENVMNEAVMQPYFVHDSIKANVLFRNMKEKGIYFAVVLDEYGGVSGIITLNDLLEQLVGEFSEEGDFEKEPDISIISEGKWKILGSASLEDVEEELFLKLPTEEFDTFGGLIFDRLGFIPDDGTQFEIIIDNLEIKVLDVQEHCVRETIVTKI